MAQPRIPPLKPGDIVIADFPKSNGQITKRPTVIISVLPGHYREFLVCAISTQMHQYDPKTDLKLLRNTHDFALSGLNQESVVRLQSFERIPYTKIHGYVGYLLPESAADLRLRFAKLFLGI